jgi:hypothetical protein
MEDDSDDESTFLKISKKSLTIFPPEITLQFNLKDLILSYNNLTQIPNAIGNLTALRNLKLDHNKISVLPPEIGNLIALTNLVLNNNELTEIPAEIENLINLHTLNLSANKLNYNVIPIIRRLKANVVSANVVGANTFTDLSLENNPIVFPIDENMNRSMETEVAYISITIHGNVPLDANYNPLLFTPPHTIKDIEIQRSCSMSSVDYLNKDDTGAFSELIKNMPGEECHFTSDFVKSCKKIEGNVTRRITDEDKDDPDYRRFARNLHNRWKPSKTFSQNMGNKYYSISSFEYFNDILKPNFSKVMLYTKHGEFDITRLLLDKESQINFFEFEINYLGKDKVPTIVKRLHLFDLKTLIDFLNTLGYKYLKIVDLTCSPFVNEKFKYQPEKTNLLQIKGELKLPEKIKSIESHFGGKKITRRRLNKKAKRKTKKYRIKSRQRKNKRK